MVPPIDDHELARLFEEYEPRAEDRRDPAPLLALQQAVGGPDRVIAAAVSAARAAGYSWRTVGSIVGVPDAQARERYGRDADG